MDSPSPTTLLRGLSGLNILCRVWLLAVVFVLLLLEVLGVDSALPGNAGEVFCACKLISRQAYVLGNIAFNGKPTKAVVTALCSDLYGYDCLSIHISSS